MSGEQSIRGAFRSNLFVFIIYRRGHGVLSGPCDAQLAEGEVSSLTWVRHHAKGSSLGIPELLPLVCVCVCVCVCVRCQMWCDVGGMGMGIVGTTTLP